MIELWSHQKQAIDIAKNKDSFGLFFEMGCGKTATAINIIVDKYKKYDSLLKTIILCPPIVVPNWKAEFLTYSGVNSVNILLLQGAGTRRLTEFRDKCMFGSCKIVVTNYESLLMDKLYDAFMQWGPHILVCDESHKCKQITAKRTKKAIGLAKGVKYKLLLTGTPVLNTPMDLFSQFLIMDNGETFGSNFFSFRHTYFYDANAAMPKQKHFPNWKVKPGAERVISSKIESKSMRVTKDQCLDLPPLVKQRIEVQMTPKQQTAYTEMKQHFITYINDQACVAEFAITKALRLQQIVSGFMKTEDDKVVSLKDTPRMSALRDLLETLTVNNKVIVWAVFKENYRQIRKVCYELKIKYVECHGEVSSVAKEANIFSFKTDKSVRVFIGHPGSGGIGINLTVSNYTIFYSRNFSLEADLQAESRNHRGGSEIHNKITRIDLVCPGTIDDEVLKALARKEKISENVLRKMVDNI